MKYLTLIRHAKSDWNEPGQTDHDRPLNMRGVQTAPLVGRFIAKTYLGMNGVAALLPKPQRLVSSTALRARTTAHLMAPEFGYGEDKISLESRAYLAEAKTLLQIVRGFDDSWSHVMLFSHNPGISDFANRLILRGELDDMPTCAAAIIELPHDAWCAADWSEGRLVGFMTPKLIEKKFAGDLTAAR